VLHFLIVHPKSVKSGENIEAELLLEVQQKAAAFEDAYNRCKERRRGTLQECLERVARDFLDALHAFSGLILDGREQNQPGPSGANEADLAIWRAFCSPHLPVKGLSGPWGPLSQGCGLCGVP
jgi:hypothetical protein